MTVGTASVGWARAAADSGAGAAEGAAALAGVATGVGAVPSVPCRPASAVARRAPEQTLHGCSPRRCAAVAGCATARCSCCWAFAVGRATGLESASAEVTVVPAPAATAPAASTAAAFAATPVPATVPPPHVVSEAGSGSGPRPLSAARRARWRRASVAHSAHSRRWARKRVRSSPASLPSSWSDSARSASPHVSGPSSCSRSARRALKSSVSTAELETSSIWAMSAYDRPSSSRITSAERWLNESAPSAFTSSRTSTSSSRGALPARSGSSATSCGRRLASRNLVRHVLCAIVISHWRACRGRSPFCIARYAFRNVVWATSSASVGFRSTISA